MSDISSLDGVQRWAQEYPREYWAFNQLPDDDPLRDDVLAAILQERTNDPVFGRLLEYANALDVHQKALEKGTVQSAPPVGLRRPYEIRVRDMQQVSSPTGLFFRVQFWTDQGWSGHFDTRNPTIVERINKRKGNEPLQIVAQVEERPHDFLVVLGGRMHLV